MGTPEAVQITTSLDTFLLICVERAAKQSAKTMVSTRRERVAAVGVPRAVMKRVHHAEAGTSRGMICAMEGALVDHMAEMIIVTAVDREALLGAGKIIFYNIFM